MGSMSKLDQTHKMEEARSRKREDRDGGGLKERGGRRGRYHLALSHSTFSSFISLHTSTTTRGR